MTPPPSATLWLLDSTTIDAEQLAALSAGAAIGAGERARLQRFVRPQRARQFLLGRLLLRRALSRSLVIHPQQITITEREGNAPLLTISDAGGMSTTPAVHFSMSHSHDWIACATSFAGPLGVDIEDRRQTRDLAALAAAGFDTQQQQWLQRQPEQQRPAAFYRLWNCQEALYKLGPHQVSANCRVIDHPEHAQLAMCLCSPVDLVNVEIITLTNL